MIAQEHEHGDEDRRQQGPYGGAAGCKEAQELAEEHEADEGRQAGHAYVFQEQGPLHGDHRRHVGPGEGCDKLGDEKGHDQKARQAFDGVGHTMYHVVGVFDFTDRHAVGQADGQEKAAQQRDDTAQQRRPQERMGLGIAEQAVVGKGHEEDDGQIQDGGDEGVAQGLFFLRRHVGNGQIFLGVGRVIYAHARFDEFFRNEGRHGRQVEYGEGHEIPVIDGRDSHRRVDSTDGLGRNTRQEDVRRDDEDVGRKSRIDGGQGTGEAD